MKTFFGVSLLFSLSACSATKNTNSDYIEGMTHRGFCKDAYGQPLTDQACSDKAIKAGQANTPAAATESEKIGKGVSEGMKNR